MSIWCYFQNLPHLDIMASMQLQELDSHLRAWLPLAEFEAIDPSLNGLQVGRRNPEVRHVAVAVDACLESFRRAAELHADLLFVHHGIFWGKECPITGSRYERLRSLLDNDLGLYAVHLPLDQHPELGNNAVMMRELGVGALQPFGSFKGSDVGYYGCLPQPLRLEQLVERLFQDRSAVLSVLPFGPEAIERVGIVSGGAPFAVDEAIEHGLDLFVTGDASHVVYHRAQEAGINVVFGGHYLTEVWGVRAVAARLESELGLQTSFIDLPTGL